MHRDRAELVLDAGAVGALLVAGEKPRDNPAPDQRGELAVQRRKLAIPAGWRRGAARGDDASRQAPVILMLTSQTNALKMHLSTFCRLRITEV